MKWKGSSLQETPFANIPPLPPHSPLCWLPFHIMIMLPCQSCLPFSFFFSRPSFIISASELMISLLVPAAKFPQKRMSKGCELLNAVVGASVRTNGLPTNQPTDHGHSQLQRCFVAPKNTNRLKAVAVCLSVQQLHVYIVYNITIHNAIRSTSLTNIYMLRSGANSG